MAVHNFGINPSTSFDDKNLLTKLAIDIARKRENHLSD